MSLEQDLLTLEEKFWSGGPEFYREHVDAKCLVAFASKAGLMNNEQVAASVESDPPRWHDLHVDPKGLVKLGSDSAVLTYEASARRANGEPYKAIVSSGYVKRGRDWKLAFHQQTPLPH